MHHRGKQHVNQQIPMRIPVGCSSGKRVLDKKTAITAANASLKEFHNKMKVYQCPECNYWHLSSVNPKKVRT